VLSIGLMVPFVADYKVIDNIVAWQLGWLVSPNVFTMEQTPAC
jgi:hypothetical protein